nr:crotonase/enoyl-CoA hydratase family protein [Mycobacterium tuberculosis]
MESGPDALVERRGHTLIVTMNRPAARNALSTEMMRIMVQAWDRVDNDPDIRCCILTGAGGYFCAGMDLKAATQKPPGDSFKDGSYDPSRIDALLKGRRLTKPLIAAVEGPAIAGGTEILQGTDIRVAGESAKFGISEAKWSLYPMGGSAVRLVRQIPYTLARTALDLARRYPVGKAVAAIDALARATDLKLADVEMLAERYRGSRGIRNARIALDLVDPGAESPRETWLRLLLIRAGFPRPQTQIPVYDEYGQLVAVIDMGWAGIKVGVDYEGDHHRTDRRTFNKDIKRAEALTELGWTDVRVTVEDTEGGIIWRVSAAWQRRT